MPAVFRLRSLALLPLLVLATLLTATLAPTPPAHASGSHQTRREKKIAHALDIVRNQKGDPYRYGAAGPGAFDCSGLVYYSFHKAGLSHVPRSSSQQARFADRIKRKNLRKGDLIFFHDNGSVYHAAVFAGWKNHHRYMIHSPHSGSHVQRDRISSNNWYAGTLRKK